MKRKIGIIALVVYVICIVLMIFMTSNASGRPNVAFQFVTVLIAVSYITAIVCLIGDVIRFIGKCFSQGFRAGNSQECSQVCPLCGKAISGNARFCGECGCELTKKSQ